MKSATAAALADAIAEAAAENLRQGVTLPASADEIPEDASAATLARLRATAEAQLEIARVAGDTNAMGAMGRLLIGIAEHARKSFEPPKEDPNENPDMIALGAQVLERLQGMINERLAKS